MKLEMLETNMLKFEGVVAAKKSVSVLAPPTQISAFLPAAWARCTRFVQAEGVRSFSPLFTVPLVLGTRAKWMTCVTTVKSILEAAMRLVA